MKNAEEYLRELAASQKRRSYQSWAYIAVGTAALLMSISGFYLTGGLDRQEKEADHLREATLLAQQRRELDQMRASIRDAQTQTSFLISRLANGGSIDSDTRASQLSLEDRALLEGLAASQKQLSDRLSALEGALMNDPVKSLAVPLLKRDLDALQDHSKADSEAIRGEIGRLFTFAEWFMGLVATAAIAAITYGFSRGKKAESSRQEPETKALEKAVSA